MKISHLFLGFALLGTPTLSAVAESKIDPKKLAFFEKEIRPLLAEHCLKCHSAAKGEDKGGLVLDSQSGWMDGGDSGPALVPGKIEESLLIEAVEQTDSDFSMPPKYKLSENEIQSLKKWVAMGAPDPRDGTGPKMADVTIDIEARRSFWSFQPVKEPAPPTVKNEEWSKDSLDRFVLAAIEEKGLKPVADSDRATLIRRTTFDLVGLPPTPEEIRSFVEDPDKDDKAFAKVVDRLIASKHFGERWGRHWLDVVRYGESMGAPATTPFLSRGNTATTSSMPSTMTCRMTSSSSSNWRGIFSTQRHRKKGIASSWRPVSLPSVPWTSMSGTAKNTRWTRWMTRST